VSERRARAHRAAVRRALERVLVEADVPAAIARDPLGLVRAFAERPNVTTDDVELVALIAACVAFGNVKALCAKLADAIERLGPSPSRSTDDPERTHAALDGWVHRVYRGEDLAALVIGARAVQRQAGSLGAAFGGSLGRHGGDVRAALAELVDAIRAGGGLDQSERRGARHLLPDPRGASGCKRLFLFLRWMVRGPDGVDLGLWRSHVSPSSLLMPVDVHIHKLARNLALTDRRTAGAATTEEITDALRGFDPEDPVRFDFALCHLGMLQRCLSRRDPVRCEGCPVRGVCRWWVKGQPI
jgi:uncharacterized protein (TIGR02757 family)